MVNKKKCIVAFMLLLVFLLPSIIKIAHHHEESTCSSSNEALITEYHEECPVCNFEFSVFTSDFTFLLLSSEQPEVGYSNLYKSVFCYSLSEFSFLLRAPPITA